MRKLIPTASLLLLILTAAPRLAAADTVDRILAVVNDEIITETDLNQVLYPVLTRLRATTSGPDLEAKALDARKRILADMIDDKLIISSSKSVDPRYKITAEPAEIDKMIVDMRKKFPSEEVFEKVMTEQGISHKELRDRFKDDIMKRKMVEFKVRSRVTLSPGENRRYYDEHPEEFAGVAEVHARQILVRAGTTRSDELAVSTVNSIVEQLKGGADFAALAKEYSEASDASAGGDMGWVRQGQFMERIDRAIFGMEKGQNSEPIKSQLGYHIFKVEETRVSEPMSYADAQQRIDNFLYKKKMGEELRGWLNELHRDAFISYQDPEIAKMMAEIRASRANDTVPAAVTEQPRTVVAPAAVSKLPVKKAVKPAKKTKSSKSPVAKNKASASQPVSS